MDTVRKIGSTGARVQKDRNARLLQMLRHMWWPTLGHIDLSGAQDVKIRDIKVVDHQTLMLRISSLPNFAVALSSKLSQHGDPKLGNASQVAAGFTASILPAIQNLATTKEDLITALLRYFRVDPATVTDEMTVADVCSLAYYGRVLEMVSLKLGVVPSLAARDFQVETIPSQLINRELERIRRDHAPRAAGSDLIDTHLAALTAYADLTFVDKRTHEYLLQLRRRCPAMDAIMKRTAKFGEADEIIRELTK